MPSRARVVPAPGNAVAKRVARYVNAHFEGNLTTTARTLPCNYDALWCLVNGTRRKPNLAVLLAFARHSGMALEWWLTGSRHVE